MWVKTIEPKKALTPTAAAYPEAPSTAGSNRLAKNAMGRTQRRRRNFPRSHGHARSYRLQVLEQGVTFVAD
jgi:hypothetical protein